MGDEVLDRERDFWDHVIPTADEVLRTYERGPDHRPREMLDAVAPLEGRRVLDFGCGGGATTLWLAARGAKAVGVDLSPASIDVARQAAARLGLDAEFRAVDDLEGDFGGPYEAVVAHLALHHVDIPTASARLASVLEPDGVGAFVETTADNPLLTWAREHLTGRFGVVRLGTLDEHPLTHADRETLRRAFGELEVRTPDYQFLRVMDRNVLRYRWAWASKAIGKVDDRLARAKFSADWSYTKLFVTRKRGLSQSSPT